MPGDPEPSRRPAGESSEVRAPAEAREPAPGAQGAGADPGTPPGSLATWVEDIRAGLEGVPARAASEEAEVRDSAAQRVLRLYVSRQESIERHYGQGGPGAGGPELSAAVDSAEAGFHRLMEATGGDAPADSAAVAARIDTLDARLEEVLRRARAAGS